MLAGRLKIKLGYYMLKDIFRGHKKHPKVPSSDLRIISMCWKKSEKTVNTKEKLLTIIYRVLMALITYIHISLFTGRRIPVILLSNQSR